MCVRLLTNCDDPWLDRGDCRHRGCWRHYAWHRARQRRLKQVGRRKEKELGLMFCSLLPCSLLPQNKVSRGFNPATGRWVGQVAAHGPRHKANHWINSQQAITEFEPSHMRGYDIPPPQAVNMKRHVFYTTTFITVCIPDVINFHNGDQ